MDVFFCFVFVLFFFNCTAQTPLHHGAETGLWGRTRGGRGRKGVELSTETEREAIGACYGGGRLVELPGKGRAAGRGSVKSGCRLSKEPSQPRVSTKTTATATPPALRLCSSARKRTVSPTRTTHRCTKPGPTLHADLTPFLFSCLSPLSLSFFIAL